MSPRLHAIAVAVIVLVLSAVALAGPKPHSVASMPPVVVKTVPSSGDTAVDPSLKQIEVTFSKDMITEQMWSFVQVSDATFPKADTPKYKADGRTIVLPVTLEPGKPYVIWVNSAKSNAFRDQAKNPAVPYLLVFETRGAPAAP